jgi:hypothetical protein
LFFLVVRPQSNFAQTIVAKSGESQAARAEYNFYFFGTTNVNYPYSDEWDITGTTTHPFWFDCSVTSSNIYYNTGVETYSYGPDTVTYTNRYKGDQGQVNIRVLKGAGSVQFDISDSKYGTIDNETGEFIVTTDGEYIYFKIIADEFTRTAKFRGSSDSLYPTENFDLRIIDTNSVKYAMRQELFAYQSWLEPAINPSVLYQFSTMDHDNTNYVRNIDFFLANVDLTCVSPWNSRGDQNAANKRGLHKGQFRTCTAITPRHLIAAQHYSPYSSSPQTTVRFITQDNQVIERTIVGQRSVSFTDELAYPVYWTRSFTDRYNENPSTLYADTVILQLNEDLPNTITPAKFLPPDFQNYMPFSNGLDNYINYQLMLYGYPLYVFNAERRVQVSQPAAGISAYWPFNEPAESGSGFYFSPNTENWGNGLYEYNDPFNMREWFISAGIDGDSSTPIFMILNGEPIYMFQHMYPRSGYPLSLLTANIQSAITSLGDTNQIQYIDLSEYQTY